MNLKYVGGIAFAATLFSSVAFAADVVVPEIIPVFSWTGAYVGLNVGFGGGKAKLSSDRDYFGEGPHTHYADTYDFHTSGFLGGVQAGYNYQIDQWVLGVEADFQGSGIKGEHSAWYVQTRPDDDPPYSHEDGYRLGTKLDWYGTVRARAGVLATDRFLVYATGGFAYGRTKSFADFYESGYPDEHYSVSKTKGGWTIGAGVEYAITDHLTWKTEYAYTDLGKTRFDDPFGYGDDAHIERKFNFHSIKVGLNYKF